jgi:hypothetical protein
MAEIASAMLVLVVLAVGLCPPLVHLIATGLERVVWALRAHADALGEYADAYVRHYARRANP